MMQKKPTFQYVLNFLIKRIVKSQYSIGNDQLYTKQLLMSTNSYLCGQLWP